MWIFPDGEGDFHAQMRFFDPNGQLMGDHPPRKIRKTARKGMHVIGKIAPFVCDATGTFESRIDLDDQTYSRRFKIV
jgi:hypothetical protein